MPEEKDTILDKEWKDLFGEMLKKVDQLETVENEIQRYFKAIHICKESMSLLKTSFLLRWHEGRIDEIHFFKVVKPSFTSRLIYHLELYNIMLDWPDQNHGSAEEFIKKQLERLSYFIEHNRFLFNYYQSEETSMDEILFVRRQEKSSLPLHLYNLDTDFNFTTQYDELFGHIMANDLVRSFLLDKLRTLNQESRDLFKLPTHIPKLTFTGPKVGAVEMVYGLFEDGAFNDGKATLSDIFLLIEFTWHIKIENHTRTWQEILSRKKGYSPYLQRLIGRVEARAERNEKKYLK